MEQEQRREWSARDLRFIAHIKTVLESIIQNCDPNNIVYADARAISVLIYELSTKYSGFASEAALVGRKEKGEDWCEEHFWPRQHSGYTLIKLFHAMGFVYEDLLFDYLDRFTIVHRTTSKENEHLRQYQQVGVFESPTKAYQLAGIKLRPWKSGARISTLYEVYPDLKPTE